MSEWVLLLAGGLLGSAHCVGMCGGFVLSLASEAPNWRLNLLRQTGYSIGRLIGYALAGAVAGYCGLRLMRSATWLVNVQAILAIVAGIVLVTQGLLSAGLIRWPQALRPRAAQRPCLMSQLFVDLRDAIPSGAAQNRQDSRALMMALLRSAWLGVLTALMPCGLLYGYLALAAASGHPLSGLLIMVAFGIGTVPLMTAFGLGMRYLSMPIRRHIWRFAAWCVLGTGVMSLVRGGQAWVSGDARPCPFCEATNP